MGWLIDPFLANTFMQRALLAGVLVSISCGVVGTFIVLRGLAFIGDALAHGVLPGIAIAILLGVPGIVGAAISAVVMIGGISLITRKFSSLFRYRHRAALCGHAGAWCRHWSRARPPLPVTWCASSLVKFWASAALR